VGVAVSFPWASCTPGPSEDSAARQSELAVRSLMAAWQSGDEALIQDLFWPQATYDDFANQQTYEGIQEIVGYVTAVHTWADDVYWNVGTVHVTEHGAVAEWVFSAIQARPIGSQIPIGTGREVVTNGVTIIELDGDRIIRAADYMDTAPLLLQMGARIEMPGGGMLELPDTL
jgi:ketosteroid isomerase-like protein